MRVDYNVVRSIGYCTAVGIGRHTFQSNNQCFEVAISESKPMSRSFFVCLFVSVGDYSVRIEGSQSCNCNLVSFSLTLDVGVDIIIFKQHVVDIIISKQTWYIHTRQSGRLYPIHWSTAVKGASWVIVNVLRRVCIRT